MYKMEKIEEKNTFCLKHFHEVRSSLKPELTILIHFAARLTRVSLFKPVGNQSWVFLYVFPAREDVLYI